MKTSAQAAAFGRRKEPHTVIIARGNEIRHFTVRPWIAAAAGSAFAVAAIGYLTATTYLVFRDDLIGATMARQARVQQAYEDRISALRAQVDRITSRQFLDQQLMETKVSELLSRQSQLSLRNGRLGPAADQETTSPADAAPPAKSPDEQASLVGAPQAETLAVATADASRPFSFWSTRVTSHEAESQADRADRLFVTLNKSLRAVEDDQIERVTTLASDAYQAADTIAETLRDAGLPADQDFGKVDVGGPLIALDGPMAFDTKVKELDDALDVLERLKTGARKLPLANPAPGRSVSSPFGPRKDPLIGSAALHSGTDLRAPYGTAALATAAGTVTKAGWNGGYGRMVEIDHGGGFVTRYAHLNKVLAVPNQQVVPGQQIGEIGSSGRSTGPHLHYEVRRNGEPIDPLRFIRIGNKLGQYL